MERQGIHVRAAGLDPRTSLDAVQSMSTRQLRSHLNELNAFTSRSNSYVAGARGKPMSGSMWREYKRLESRHNENSRQFYDSIKGLNIPGTGGTIEDRLNNLSKRRPTGDYNTFQTLDRSAGNLTGQNALDKMLASMQRKTDPRYLEREARLQRKVIRKMVAQTSNKDLDKLVRDLDDKELITLAQYTDFMTALESSYAMAKSTSSDRPRWQSAVYEDNEDKIASLLDWANTRAPQKAPGTKETTRGAGSKRTPGTQSRDGFGRFAVVVTGGTPGRPDPVFNRDSTGRFAPKPK